MPSAAGLAGAALRLVALVLVGLDVIRLDVIRLDVGRVVVVTRAVEHCKTHDDECPENGKNQK